MWFRKFEGRDNFTFIFKTLIISPGIFFWVLQGDLKKKKIKNAILRSQKIVRKSYRPKNTIIPLCFTNFRTAALICKMANLSVFTDSKIKYTGVKWKFQNGRKKSVQIFRKIWKYNFIKLIFTRGKKNLSPTA